MKMFKILQQKLASQNSITFKVKIVPKSSRNQIVGEIEPGTVKIKIAAVAAKGKANEELIRYLSEIFEKPKKNISIISGMRSPLKIIKIDQ